MELRELQAFVAVANDLHFARAAERLYISPATLSDLIRRLETELGTPLFIRTTRRVSLTAAGSELLTRATKLLDDAAAARIAIREIGEGSAGVVRLGITPPVAPVLAPHLITQFATEAPGVGVEVHRLWLPNLIASLAAGNIDVAITCGRIPTPEGMAGEVICADPLFVGLRPGHRMSGEDSVKLEDLAGDVLGISSEQLFPAWHLSQRQALEAAQLSPPIVELADTDLAGGRWSSQAEVDWVLLISSLVPDDGEAVMLPVTPDAFVPFTMQWSDSRSRAPAADRFVAAALRMTLPPGWARGPAGTVDRA